ncbi:methyl-accepting chemotaxis protein, partial [Bacillus thuringiensis]|nr:methyl-accepting chemotaxis protein [Bacillus thuringiensis]MDY4395413.1 methyl-accepting chemotaxis protein [Bacillus thuringiensis]
MQKSIKSIRELILYNSNNAEYNTFYETFNKLRTQMKKAQELGKSNNEEAYAYYLKEIEPNMQ